MIELMQRYSHLKMEAAEHDIGLALVADAELFRLDGIVRCCPARSRPGRSSHLAAGAGDGGCA
jgi:hypothetical protein